MTKHAKYSPSNARWLKCPGSVREEATYPDVSSKAAIDGTGTHVLLHDILKEFSKMSHIEKKANRVKIVESFIGRKVGADHDDGPWKVSLERAQRVQIAVDYVLERIGALGDGVRIELERKVDAGAVFDVKDWWGTCDIALISNSTVEVIDYKDGAMYVDAKTSQMTAYAIGMLEYGQKLLKHNIPMVRKTIIQPRTANPVRYINISPGDLKRKGGKLVSAIKLAEKPDAPLIPGGHCRWCKHKSNCAAHSLPLGHAIVVQDVESMASEDLAELLDVVPKIKKYIEEATVEATARLERGQIIPSYGMIQGRRPAAKWIDGDTVRKRLRGMRFKHDQYTITKLFTPTQLMQLPMTDRQRGNMKKLTIRPEPKKKLSKLIQKTAEEMFSESEVVPEVMYDGTGTASDGVIWTDQEKTNKDDVVVLSDSDMIPPPVKVKVMTKTAKFTYEEYNNAGWTDQQLIDGNLMEVT